MKTRAAFLAAILCAYFAVPVILPVVAPVIAPAFAATSKKPVEKKTKSFEREALEKSLMYCIQPVASDIGVEYAARLRLPELKSDRAAFYSKSGRAVFNVLTSRGEIGVMETSDGSCQYFIRKIVDVAEFWKQIDNFFGPKTPFILLDTVNDDSGVTKTYTSDLKGPTALLVSVRDTAPADKSQVIMTFSRIKQSKQK